MLTRPPNWKMAAASNRSPLGTGDAPEMIDLPQTSSPHGHPDVMVLVVDDDERARESIVRLNPDRGCALAPPGMKRRRSR